MQIDHFIVKNSFSLIRAVYLVMSTLNLFEGTRIEHISVSDQT